MDKASIYTQAADEIERLRVALNREAQRLDDLVSCVEVLWEAFGRDPEHIEEYVSDHGLRAVIVDDFAVSVRAMRERLGLT